MALRDHEAVTLEEFNGLWKRGDPEKTPFDHFIQADNIQYFPGGFETRNPISPYQTGGTPILTHVVRVYNYVMQTGQSILALDDQGNIYHIKDQATIYGPILTIPAMTDFGFTSYAGRAYISPFTTYPDSNGINHEKGLSGDFVYVYNGDGSAAKKIGGAAPTNSGIGDAPAAFNSAADGQVTKGVHIIGISWGGGPMNTTMVVNAPGGKMIQVFHALVGTGSRVVYMTTAMTPAQYVATPSAYTFYKINEAFPDTYFDSVLINTPDEILNTPYSNTGGPAFPASTAMVVENTNSAGHCDFGYHVIGVVYETDTGYLTPLGPELQSLGQTTFINQARAIKVSNIPCAPTAERVVKRHLVSTKTLPYYNGNPGQYQFFFIPGADLNDNTTTTLTISYFDADLVDDASHLSDNFTQMAAGVALNTYHSRLVLVGEYNNPSVARLSAPGEPESFSQVDGLITAPLDGNPLTNAQEFRDILYLFKRTRTYGYSDNGDVPATWMPGEVIDEAIGAPVHGISTVLDSGGVNIDFLLVGDLSGLILFNGVYARPELSWKIEDYWYSLHRNEFRRMQIVNDSISKRIWIVLPPSTQTIITPFQEYDRAAVPLTITPPANPYQTQILHADYSEAGLDAKTIKWANWKYDGYVTSIALIAVNQIVLGTKDYGLLSFQTTSVGGATGSRIDTYYGPVQHPIPDPTIKTGFFGS